MTIDGEVDLRHEVAFKDRLGDELREAALRIEAPTVVSPKRRWWFELPPMPVLAVGAVALLLLIAGVAVLRPGASEPAAADLFEVTREGETITVSVVDLVADASAAEAELRSAGIDVEIRSVPVSPQLVGHLVSIESGFDDQVVEASSGRIQSITFIPDRSTPLVLEVGRQAELEENFVYSAEPALCTAVFAASDLVRKAEVAASLGYARIAWRSPQGEWVDGAAAEEQMAAGARIVAIDVKSPGELLIVLSDDPAETREPCS